MTTVRIGTRGSALALAQARLVAEGLAAAGQGHAVVVIETEGDRLAPDTAWGEGAFVAAIERALLAGDVDVAVHSAKDVPTDEDPRLSIAAFLPRADPLDALVLAAGSDAGGLDGLPPASRVGTDSPRRAGFLRALRPDLAIQPLHGNVDTRLRRLDDGEVDALVLAVAGLARLGRGDRVTERLAGEVVPPAPGQGAIAVQVRADDAPTRDAVTVLDDAPTRVAVEAERAFLRAAGGGCRAPIGALALVEGTNVRLLGGLATEDGRTAIEAVDGSLEDVSERAGELAYLLAGRLARMPMTAVQRRPSAHEPRTGRPQVLVTRPALQADRLADRLRAEGLEPISVPAIAIEPVEPGAALDDALLRLPAADWAIVTSPNGARTVVAAARRLGVDLMSARWAAVGGATARELAAGGIADVWQPRTASGAAAAVELPAAPGARVLVLRGSLADPLLPAELRRRGCEVREAVAYRTLEAPAGSRAQLEQALGGPAPEAILFASGSAVRGILALAGDRRSAVLAIPAICIGPETAREARAAGFRLLGESAMQSTEAIAALAGRLLRAGPAGEIR